MKEYKGAITLIKNSRGCYILDTVKGCTAGSLYEGKGCYGDCYAKNIADRYGFDFLKVKTRKFEENDDQFYMLGFTDDTHKNQIIKIIKSADMPFIRIGEMGDPSLAWAHTLTVCEQLAGAMSESGKKMVIITKHWKAIPEKDLKRVQGLDLCINTSVSALDNHTDLEYRLKQFERLKNVCNSVLRIVSCDFNRENADGNDRAIVQEELFKIGGAGCIDTVFRPSKNNHFVSKNIIKTKSVRFMRSKVLASVYNENTYRGMCDLNCPDLCGIKTARKAMENAIDSGV